MGFRAEGRYKFELEMIEQERLANIKSLKDEDKANQLAHAKKIQLEIAYQDFLKRVKREEISTEALNDLLNHKFEKITQLKALEIEGNKTAHDMVMYYITQEAETRRRVMDEPISATYQLGDSLFAAFDRSGNHLISKIRQAFNIALRIADAMNNSESPGLLVLGQVF